MNIEQFTANWNYPTTIRSGIGRINDLPAACSELGMQNPLIVTDPGLAELPMVLQALKHCQTELKGCGLFADIKGNPTGENVEAGVAACKAGNHDGVIAFGGGSALDAGKAIALMVGQDRPIWDFEDVGDNYLRVNVEGMLPVVAVPTTSGTGSEVGRASVITHQQEKVKKIIFHARMLPEIVILDPELTCGLPAKITAATGMDALSHNLEAFCSPFYHPMAHGIAIEGIKLVKDWLPAAVADGSNLQARAQMLVASTMGATAFQKGLGAMHALAHPLGALYDAHHGLLNAILMPYVLKANQSAIENKVTELSRYLDLPEPGFDSFLNWVVKLRSELGIPHSLSEIGIDDSQVQKIGQMAFDDPSSGTNPILFTADEYQTICTNAVRGNL
ncbi:alcohol dehydrogenase [Endozoicomonas sp. OPT23]|uniref:iron-containing alcohol dehydrogenase n=1 Tax=Endozoicomonas sp. OPT23 TaxID=2072845 RepID=UPI00129A970C|nr:iron-containing alcohol dehydrogenase [Endozoicomonas sp. OPT23]MRI31764.1 alcohol dehydrogenase [Endozoicomonas sp. OPT23]